MNGRNIWFRNGCRDFDDYLRLNINNIYELVKVSGKKNSFNWIFSLVNFIKIKLWLILRLKKKGLLVSTWIRSNP